MGTDQDVKFVFELEELGAYIEDGSISSTMRSNSSGSSAAQPSPSFSGAADVVVVLAFFSFLMRSFMYDAL